MDPQQQDHLCSTSSSSDGVQLVSTEKVLDSMSKRLNSLEEAVGQLMLNMKVQNLLLHEVTKKVQEHRLGSKARTEMNTSRRLSDKNLGGRAIEKKENVNSSPPPSARERDVEILDLYDTHRSPSSEAFIVTEGNILGVHNGTDQSQTVTRENNEPTTANNFSSMGVENIPIQRMGFSTTTSSTSVFVPTINGWIKVFQDPIFLIYRSITHTLGWIKFFTRNHPSLQYGQCD